MAITTTRGERGDRPRAIHAFLTVTVAISAFGLLSAAAVAQVKAPTKSQFKARAAAAPSPTDNQAESLNEKWLNEFNKEKAEKPAAAAPAAAEADDERVSTV